eukprot:Blabericola_migrator_1__381@NODE_1095_length_5456_cov_10_727964_g750_i0_p1_GENE_NODE_1095_length_5456_cov_10_727964_g750_i0NODE_1095_length_5456_cov_10_727964_g750_i0_p1_ORF_typecomplete_len308_score38_43_NODE_1095_length_5456_cov_10_727964_g750_i02671190
MSARHLQKHKQINLKDGTLGTALLVTLAMNQPAGVQALDSESHIPSDSYTGPPPESATSTPSLNLLDSGEMLRSDPSTSDWRRWVALRIGCSLQMCQTKVVDGSYPPIRHRKLGELYTPVELQGREDPFSLLKPKGDQRAYADSTVNERRAEDIKDTVKFLLDAQQGAQATQWNEYKTKHRLQAEDPEAQASIHTDFHAAQWLFTNAAPEFFAEQRPKFVKLAKVIFDWTNSVVADDITGDFPKMRKWPYITSVIKYGKLEPWVAKTFGELDAVFRDRHGLQMSREADPVGEKRPKTVPRPRQPFEW